ncbi:MAG TPA: NAD(P)H-hydrate dehydratase [Candidatus Limnocylindrales bacterium]|nr:NAD(P)H-hydrate dehydratase [Candidatus Limnocylindrales bacterium]
MAERRAVGFGRLDDARRDPALPSGASLLDDEAAAALLPERPARGHKGTFGRVLVIAGSLDFAGAALLVCRAAGRAGCGLVTLAVPESLQPLFAGKVVEATTMALPEDDVEEIEPHDALARILDDEHDALVVGPGLRPGLATTELVRELVRVPGEAAATPLVLDAEALRSLASVDGWWDGVADRAVLTPHPGEFARLRAGSGDDVAGDGDISANDEARVTAARSAAAQWGQVIVLKGARTVVAAPGGETAIATFENPAMASGGTGDVLSGVIGSLLAQGLTPFAAARLGVYLHGQAGELVRERLGDAGLLAGDLPDALPLARRRLAAIAERRKSGARLGFRARHPEPGDGPASDGSDVRATRRNAPAGATTTAPSDGRS